MQRQARGACATLLRLLLLLLALSQAQPVRAQLDGSTCQLLCVSCEKSRLIYAQHCANNSSANATAAQCPCLQLPPRDEAAANRGNCSDASAACPRGHLPDSNGCPEPQPPPPPPGCPAGGSVRCDLGGPGGRCYGNCACLTTAGDPAACPPDPCPASNCRAYADDGCRRCTDCAINPWWCFAEPPDNCGNATEVCGGSFHRDPDGCQVDCSCAADSEASPARRTTSPPPGATSPSCHLPGWLSASCRRYCRRRHGGQGRLQVDERGCERCRCCQPCELPRDSVGRARGRSRHGGHRQRDDDCQAEVDSVTGCPGCGICTTDWLSP